MGLTFLPSRPMNRGTVLLSQGLRGALTTRPYKTTTSVFAKSYASASTANFAPNPFFDVDTSVVKGDNFDFWAHRAQQTSSREAEFKKEANDLIQKYEGKNGSEDAGVFRKNLELALSEPVFRETVGTLSGNNFDKFKPVHFQAVAEREANRGEPSNVRTIHMMMLTVDMTTNEQDYTLLFRSYWKNGTAADLVSVLKEMKLFGLKPTQSMVDLTVKACQAAKDSKGEQEVKSLSSSANSNKNSDNASFKTRLEEGAKLRLQRMDLNRRILSEEGPAGDFFFSMFDTHKA